jgi:hypothetical protein
MVVIIDENEFNMLVDVNMSLTIKSNFMKKERHLIQLN